ncbi:MAG: hypothetical protein IT531_17960 [Burkholderiales bacterium]|nr:hypothetical protein [Burkholderiales bacterium]
MFKWLAKQFTQADDDPDSLGSERGLDNFIAALPVTLPARTIEAIGEQFEHAAALQIEASRLRRALKRLDERAQEPLAQVWLDLFEDERGRRISDGAWLALARYYRNLHTGYRVCLDALAARAPQGEAERSDTVVIGCRAMTALGRYKSLLRLRYRDVEPSYWEHAIGLASSSEGAGTGTLIELYPHGGYQTSVEREFLIALLFEAAPIANLLPAQMAALDLVLRRFATHYQFSESYRESTPFVLDPGRDPIVRRWLKGLRPRPGQRFFGAAGAYAQLGALRKQALASAAVPDWLAPARLDSDAYRSLLHLVIAHWSVEPPQRQHRRDRTEGEVLATHGVGQVRRMIAASEFAKAGGQLSYEENTPYDHKLFGKLRFGSVGDTGEDAGRAQPAATAMETLQKFELEGDRQMTERWAITDISETGLGAFAQAHGGWARIGMLVGYRRLDSLEWQTAVLRRLSRTAQGRLSIGLQTIPADAACARLRIGSGDAGNTWVAVAGTADIYHDAILLRGEGAPSLLLDQGAFAGPIECMISFEKRWRRARLEGVLERGYDYERVEITLLPDLPPSG